MSGTLRLQTSASHPFVNLSALDSYIHSAKAEYLRQDVHTGPLLGFSHWVPFYPETLFPNWKENLELSRLLHEFGLPQEYDNLIDLLSYEIHFFVTSSSHFVNNRLPLAMERRPAYINGTTMIGGFNKPAGVKLTVITKSTAPITLTSLKASDIANEMFSSFAHEMAHVVQHLSEYAPGRDVGRSGPKISYSRTDTEVPGVDAEILAMMDMGATDSEIIAELHRPGRLATREQAREKIEHARLARNPTTMSPAQFLKEYVIAVKLYTGKDKPLIVVRGRPGDCHITIEERYWRTHPEVASQLPEGQLLGEGSQGGWVHRKTGKWLSYEDAEAIVPGTVKT